MEPACRAEPPWPKPGFDECFFYHAMSLPETGAVAGEWDIRPYYEEYVGGVDLAGKRVLDVGAASGMVGFEAERRGATVTAFDLASPSQIAMVPFAGYPWQEDPGGWWRGMEAWVRSMKCAWWYAWHEYRSRIEIRYGELAALSQVLPRQQVVIAGAFLEHMADPVRTLGQLARLAEETLVIGFTPVAPGPGRFMRPITEWRPETAYAWWELSEELYRAVLDGCGFDLEIRPARALHRGTLAERHSLVARRR